MKNKKCLKLNLYLLLIIGLLASFTYTPSNAKYYKEEDNALLYKAKFNQMGGYYIDDSSIGMGLQDNDSTASLIRYKFNFIRSEDMKSGEVDTYTLTLPDSECISTFYDGTANVEAKSISFSTLEGMGNSIVVNLTCPVNKVINNDTINLSIKVKQQFTDEREYEYATGLFSIDASKYLENKIDKLEDNIIYLIKSNNSDIYNRFVTLLKEYVHNNETSFNEALADYLKDSNTLDSLLDEYLSSIFTTGSDNITVTDLERISGITLSISTKYNQLTISDDFIKAFKQYFDLRKDFLNNNSIYLSKFNNANIYNRFVTLLREYIHNNETSFNEALVDYLNDANTLDSLLDEYLASIFTTGIDNISINDLTKISGIIVGSDTSYNEFIIDTQFKDELKRYFDLRDYIVGNTIRLSKLNTENIEQRIKNLLASQDTNINLDEINIFIKDHLEEAKREIPSEYNNIEGLSYSDTVTHSIITIEPNFSSYVKTYYYNDNSTTTPKNFYFFNENLSSTEINTLFYKYLDEYLYKNSTPEYNVIQNYIQSNFDAITNNVIALAMKLDLEYFKYNSSTYAIRITSELYNTLVNGKRYSVQKSLPINFKINTFLKPQLEKDITDSTIVDAIITDNNFLNVIGITSGSIDETINIVSGTNNIMVQVTSTIEEVDIYIKVTITTIINDVPIEDEPLSDTPVTPPVVPSEEPTPLEPIEDKEEEPEEPSKTTDPTIEIEVQTQDDVGVISYPITSSTDNTLGEEKKYMFIKPEDE